MPLPPPGWMSDPSVTGLERYWDGARWTGRTRDAITLIEGPPPAWRPTAQPVYSASSSAWAPTPARPQFSIARVLGAVTMVVAIAMAVVVFDTPVSRALRAEGILPADAPALTVPGGGAVVGVVPGTAPESPAVEYPVTGSTALVRYLEASMIARVESIDVAYWTAQAGGDALLDDALREALTQNPYVYVNGWQVLSMGSRVVSVEPTYTYDVAETQVRQTATRDAVARALGVLALDGASIPDQVRAIHDYVAQAATYDYGAAELISANETSTDPRVAQSQEAYGILVAGTAVCNGYAQAFKAIADAAGLTVVTVTGEAWSGMTSGGHAWNRVLVDGAWLTVDVTWDDGGDYVPVPTDYLLLPAGDPALTTRAADADWAVDASIAGFGG